MSAPAPSAGSPGLRASAALLVLGPACIHLAVVPEHLVQYVPYGIFFIVVGLAQAGLAAGVLVRPSPPLLLGGAAGNLAVIGVWLVSRTVGLPGLPGMPEPIGMPDLLTTYMEYFAVVLLLLADVRLDRARRFRPLLGGPGVALALVVSVTFTFISLAGVATTTGH